MSTERPPVTNIIFGTMTLGYRGYGSRVHDTATAAAMLTMYSDAGYQAMDTAHDYGGDSGEQMLGDLGAAQQFTIATRYAPQGTKHAQERDKLKAAFRLSLTRLRTDRVRIFYPTTRDHTVPLESTLRGIQDLHDEGLFDEFGLSNFSVADIEDVLAITTREGWIPPTVYQGLYNALSRVVDRTLSHPRRARDAIPGLQPTRRWSVRSQLRRRGRGRRRLTFRPRRPARPDVPGPLLEPRLHLDTADPARGMHPVRYRRHLRRSALVGAPLKARQRP